MCGSAEINGYTFCLGLNKLQLFYEDHSDLQGLIRSITYLIRGAIFRPKYTTSPSGGLSLGELLDLYHTRESTVPNDKVYALLGMSSDDPRAAGLSPDYTVPWTTLLQRLIKYILFEEVSVETWDKREMAVIKSKGCILGHVSSVEDDSARYDRQHVNVVFNNTPKSLEYEREYSTRWTLQASAKSVRKRDFVCLLQGASKPTIIRAYKDHFAVIVIAVTLRQSVRIKSGYVERQEPLASAKNFSHDFLLVWNWEKSQGNLQNQARYETPVEINDLVPEYLKTALDKATRSCDVALAFEDSKEYEETEKRLQEAIDGCERASGKKDPHMLAFIDSLALIYGSQKQWTKAEDLFLQVIYARKRVQGIDHQDTLNSIANLASNYIYQGYWSVGEREMVTSLTDRLRNNIQIAEEVVVEAARSFGKGPMTLLLDLKKDNVPVTEAVVKAAAGNASSGKEVMALLLDQRGDEVKITEEVVKAAAANHYGRGIMALLLRQRGHEVKITEEVLKEAASNESASYRMVQLLYQTVSINVTVGVIEAAATSGQEQVLGLFDQWDSIGSDKERWLNISRLYNAARNGDAGTVRQLVADGTPPDKQNIRGATPLWRASKSGRKEVVEVLLATSAVEVNVRSINGQTPLFWAAAFGYSEVVRLLLDHGAELNYTDKDGESPLSMARFRRQATVIAMLTRHEPTTRTSE
jgi:tetratricopeptide (TPR) repeat protein